MILAGCPATLRDDHTDIAYQFMVGCMGSLSTVSSWINDTWTIRHDEKLSVLHRIICSLGYFVISVGVCCSIAACFVLT